MTEISSSVFFYIFEKKLKFTTYTSDINAP